MQLSALATRDIRASAFRQDMTLPLNTTSAEQEPPGFPLEFIGILRR